MIAIDYYNSSDAISHRPVLPQILGDLVSEGLVQVFLMVPAGEQGEARRMTGIFRSVVGQVGMPEHHVACLRGKLLAAGGRVVAEHVPRKPLDFQEAAVDMRGMLEKVPVSGVVASRPVDQGPAAGFHVVQVGCRSDHEGQPASPVGVDMARLGHFP